MQSVGKFSKMEPFGVLIYYNYNFTDKKIRTGKFKLSFKLVSAQVSNRAKFPEC